jgi:hypothetical protein
VLKKIHLRRSLVTCVDCGFLAFGNQEVGSGDRWMLASQGTNAKMPVLTTLCCYRSLWVQYDTDYFGNPDAPKLDEVNEIRRCEGFRRYKPGLSPQQHMEQMAKADERKAQFGYMFLAALLASVLTLCGQWAAKHFGLAKP